MNAAVRPIRSHTPPTRNPCAPPAREPVRVQLKPIAWGTRDRDLARGLCHHILGATPPTVIPFNPFTNASMRRALRSLGIHTQ